MFRKFDSYIEACSKDRKLWVRVSRKSLDIAFELCKVSGSLETGGIITGCYSSTGMTCTISKLHNPSTDSKSGRFNFENGHLGLKDILSKLWRKKEYYLGDWHLHPKSKPIPSKQDLNQLKEISTDKNLKCRFPLMLIIGEDTNKNFCISIFGFKSDIGLIEFDCSEFL